MTNLLWRLRNSSPEAIEAHFIPEMEVRLLVKDCGGSAALVEENEEGPEGWESRRYFCVKRKSR